MHEVKRSGISTEPCGILHESITLSDTVSLFYTDSLMPYITLEIHVFRITCF